MDDADGLVRMGGSLPCSLRVVERQCAANSIQGWSKFQRLFQPNAWFLILLDHQFSCWSPQTGIDWTYHKEARRQQVLGESLATMACQSSSSETSGRDNQVGRFVFR